MKEATFPVGKLLELRAAVGQHRSADLDILVPATHPAAFCGGECVGIEAVLTDYIRLCCRLTVVPDGGDGTCHLAVSLLCIIDIALVYAHQICKDIKVVDVVVAAVDIGQSVYLPAAAAPHLRHVDIGQVRLADGDAADGIPYDAFAAERLLDVL